MSSARRRIVVAASVLALAAGGGLWLLRVPIATRVIDRELAARGVPARYAITDLGLGRQRLTGVVIGDPAHPDLVADWVETRTDLTLSGPTLTAVRAGRVRIAARLVDGRVTLGTIDRLLPPPSGAPFALPALDVDVADARIALATPHGPVALRVAGRGKLNDEFRGRLRARAPALDVAGCRIEGLTTDVTIGIARAAPRLAGPVTAASFGCAGGRARALASGIDVMLSPALDRWSGRATLAAAGVETTAARLARVSGTVAFAGDAARTGGRAELATAGVAATGGRSGAARFAGTWRLAEGRATVAGRLSASDVAVAARWRARVAAAGEAAAGSPVAPLAAGLARDVARAARAMDVGADLALATGTPTLLTLRRARIAAASGARLALDDGAVVIGHPAGVRIAGQVAVAGGGLPRATVRLDQAAPGAPVRGTATIAPYARGGAALALTPLRFTAGGGGATRITAGATLSGPLAGGRIERLALPLDLRWDGRGRLDANRACTPVSFARLALSGLVLRPATLRLCPAGGALVQVAGGRVAGSARIGATTLAGMLGDSPLRISVGAAAVRLADRDVMLSDVAARIGAADHVTRLEAKRLRAVVRGDGVAGDVAGADGRIAEVPLELTGAAGAWRFAQGVLRVTGGLQVSDAATPARFAPLLARDVTLSLAGGAIDAHGTLVTPSHGVEAGGVKVAEVTIAHALASRAGHARLAVPGITFGETLQPDQLTRLTFGVIADVRGTVSGEGDIRWDAQGVSSSGAFTTAGTDLAAAFGPVQGLSGTIRFTDLLGLVTAPGQVATVASINPGVPVTDGRIVYRLLPGLRVQVEDGRWPFAGGTLTLEPTVLDFAAEQQRRMTFRVDGMDAGKFLLAFDFENLNATGTFDGVLPMVFDERGGRIEGGRLAARPGGGGIAYLGALTEKDLGFWGNLAFQSLRSLTYRNLEVEMNGPLAGEMVTGVRFSGIRQGKGATSNFLLRRLTRLPIQFNITIRAPFRGLIDSAASFYDPQRLVKRNLQALIDEQNRRTGVQPPASDTVPPPQQD